MNLINYFLIGLQGEFVGDSLEDGDLIVKLPSVSMGSVPPLLFSLFHRLNLEGEIGHFLTSDLDEDGLILFDIKLEHVMVICDFLAF